tara:strand:- start:341 stop:478 length:138 start_codon:yes stop_codon:yes gene_type:complete
LFRNCLTKGVRYRACQKRKGRDANEFGIFEARSEAVARDSVDGII